MTSRTCSPFQRDAALDWLGVFAYSREEDTPAWSMAGRVPRAVAESRKAAIEQAQVPITEAALDRHVGSRLDVLVEEPFQDEELSLGQVVPAGSRRGRAGGGAGGASPPVR